jgi:signal transduction histidine kinase
MKYAPPVPYTTAAPDTCGADGESIREDERRRIARDIHDELGQQLLVLKMDVVLLRERVAATHPQLDGAVAGVLMQLDTAMRSMRAVIRGLRPAVLEPGLRAAVEWQCAEFMRHSGIVCDLAWSAGDIAVNDRCATALFRTLQESLTNVRRHAQATRVQIDVRHDGGMIVMTVSDNGIGILPYDGAKKAAFGLSGMRERIYALGGELAIHGTAHGGVTLTASLPA